MGNSIRVDSICGCYLLFLAALTHTDRLKLIETLKKRVRKELLFLFVSWQFFKMKVHCMRESVCECGFYDLFSLNLLSFPVAENCQSVWDARFFFRGLVWWWRRWWCAFSSLSPDVFTDFFLLHYIRGKLFNLPFLLRHVSFPFFPSVLHKIPYKFDMIFIFSSSIRFLPWLELSWKSITPGRNVPSLREQKLQLLLTTFYWFRWWCWRWLVGWLHSGR